MEGPINEAVTEGGPNDQSRREFLKRSAVAGAVAWSAPAILSLPGGAAWAGHYPCPCDCDATATAAVVLGSPVLQQTDTGCQCVVDLAQGPLEASLACAKVDDDHCSASTYLENVDIALGSIPLVGDIFIHVATLGSCATCGTGDAYVADAAVFVGSTGTALNLSSNCNAAPVTVNVQGTDVATVWVNEQSCDNGTLTVNALRVESLLSGDTVVVGRSQAGGPDCPCTICAEDDPDVDLKCTPPTSRLC